MHPAQAAIYGTGLTLSISGTVMWAWNDFGVWLVGVGVDIGRIVRSGIRRALVRVHLVKPAVVFGASSLGMTLVGGGTGYVTVPDSASVEEKVRFLLKAHGEHEIALAQLRNDLDRGLKQVRDDLRNDIASEVHRLGSDNIRVRRCGVALVIIGVVLLAAAPFA
ncbi:MAG: hypothetical protein ACJ752_00555 [Gaiellaceae bacterium]